MEKIRILNSARFIAWVVKRMNLPLEEVNKISEKASNKESPLVHELLNTIREYDIPHPYNRITPS